MIKTKPGEKRIVSRIIVEQCFLESLERWKRWVPVWRRRCFCGCRNMAVVIAEKRPTDASDFICHVCAKKFMKELQGRTT